MKIPKKWLLINNFMCNKMIQYIYLVNVIDSFQSQIWN